MLQPLLFFSHTVKCYISGHGCNCLFCAFAYTAVRTRHAVGTVPGNYRYFSSFNYWSYLLLIINASRMRERSSAVSLVISYTLTGQLSVGFRFGYGCSLLYNLCVSWDLYSSTTFINHLILAMSTVDSLLMSAFFLYSDYFPRLSSSFLRSD